MIDRQFIGHTMPAFEVLVEKGRLKFFAKATGQTDPVYTDEAAARAAGHRAWPVPPTVLFCLQMVSPQPLIHILPWRRNETVKYRGSATNHTKKYTNNTMLYRLHSK